MNTSPARGYCLVISMRGKVTNEYPKGDREPGNSKDVDKLRSLFEDTLKFAFKVYKDFSRSEINELLSNVQNDKWSSCCCFVVFILAHGDTDDDGNAVFTTCNQVKENDKNVKKYIPYKVSTIKRRLESTEGLHGKPKLLFLQSCRGNIDNIGVCSKDSDKDGNGMIPYGSDFLISFATIEKHAAYRDEKGSPFIRQLYYVFNTYRTTHDIVSMMIILTKRMSFWRGETTKGVIVKQIPDFTSTLRKFLYFFNPQPDKGKSNNVRL